MQTTKSLGMFEEMSADEASRVIGGAFAWSDFWCDLANGTPLRSWSLDAQVMVQQVQRVVKGQLSPIGMRLP